MRILVTQPGRRSDSLRANLDAVEALVAVLPGGRRDDDVLLLPELVGGDTDPEAYEMQVQALALRLGAWVVGGSHFARDGEDRTNRGIVADPAGRTVARYGKLNPYGEERSQGARPGQGPATFKAGGFSCLVMICADFWHAPAFGETGPAPDLILVPAFSASQRPQPHMARARWRHAMVARAYEFAAYVAVSDWAHPTPFAAGVSSGVAGLARPNPCRPGDLHQALGRRRVAAFDLDLDAVHDLRANREGRGFDLTRHLRTGQA